MPQHDCLDLFPAGDLDRGVVEAEHDAPVPRCVLADRGLLCVPTQHLDIGRDGLAGRGGVLVGDPGQVGRIHDDVDTLEFAEFAQFQGGERALQRPAPTDDDHLGHTALVQSVQGVVGDVGLGQHVGVGHQDAGHVDGDVAVADHHRPSAGDVGRHSGEVRVGVVPADEVHGRDTSRQVLARDAQRPVRLGAHGVDDGVIALGEFVGRDVGPDRDVAEEAESRIGRRLLEGAADRLDLGVVGRDARTNQAPGGRQHLEHVDVDVRASGGDRLVGEFQQRRGGEISGRAGTDDRHVKGTHAWMVNQGLARPVS